MMRTVKLEISLPATLSAREAKLLLAIKLFEVGKVTMGQAAKLVGLSKRTFTEMLGLYKIPVFNSSPEELRGEALRLVKED